MNRLTLACTAALSATTLFAAPTITGVTMSQDADSRLVTISYTLEGTAQALVNVSVLSNGVDIGQAALEGANGTVSGLVQPGKHTITWRPTKSWPGHVFQNKEISAQVKAWSFNATPDYMILDLEDPANIRYYEKTEDFPVALGDDCYRKRYIVMRKIPAAGVEWRMGTPQSEIDAIDGTTDWYQWQGDLEKTHYVTLTKDYYMAIYELTAYQYNYVDTGDTTGATTPIYKSYNTVRGTGKVWPADGYTLDGTGWLTKLRNKFGGLYEFDLPTEAQWEFACRAGVRTSWYNGKNIQNEKDVNVPDLSAIAWYSKSSGTTVQVVGKLPANDYGLYDMLGNYWELCLDNAGGDRVVPYDTTTQDPKGCTTVSDRVVIRGGGIWDCQYLLASGRRNALSRTKADYHSGIRLCVTLP